MTQEVTMPEHTLIAQILKSHRRNFTSRPEIHGGSVNRHCIEGCLVPVDEGTADPSLELQFLRHAARWLLYAGFTRTGDETADVQLAGILLNRHQKRGVIGRASDGSWQYRCMDGCVVTVDHATRQTASDAFWTHQAEALTDAGFTGTVAVVAA